MARRARSVLTLRSGSVWTGIRYGRTPDVGHGQGNDFADRGSSLWGGDFRATGSQGQQNDKEGIEAFSHGSVPRILNRDDASRLGPLQGFPEVAVVAKLVESTDGGSDGRKIEGEPTPEAGAKA